MDAAEDDRPALPVAGRQFGQPVAVAAEVGQGDHLVLLVVVAEDQQPRAHFRPNPLDPLAQLRVLQQLVRGQIEGRSGGGRRGTDADGSSGRCSRHTPCAVM